MTEPDFKAAREIAKVWGAEDGPLGHFLPDVRELARAYLALQAKMESRALPPDGETR